MTSKLFFAIGISFISIFGCVKSDMPKYVPPPTNYNFECYTGKHFHYTNYDTSFVKLTSLYTDYNNKSKKLTIVSNYLGTYFNIEVDSFDKIGPIDSNLIKAKLDYFKKDALGPIKYNYEIDYSKSARFNIDKIDTVNNQYFGTFLFSLKPIDSLDKLDPIDITKGKFRLIIYK